MRLNPCFSSGFISIDCGASEDYTDEKTGIKYATDDKYVDTGERQEDIFRIRYRKPCLAISECPNLPTREKKMLHLHKAKTIAI